MQLLTNPVFGLDTIKIPTNVLQTTINGTVTNVQNGQQGPATIIGLPSFLSIKKNIDPTRLAQQQKYLLKSSMVNVKHGLSASVIGPEDDEFGGGSPRLLLSSAAFSRSHLTDTAYLLQVYRCNYRISIYRYSMSIIVVLLGV